VKIDKLLYNIYMSSSTTHINNALRIFGGFFLIFGVSVLCGSMPLSLHAGVNTVIVTGQGSFALTPTAPLHGAALPFNAAAERTSQELLLGMLLLIAALFVYTLYIVRKQKEPHSLWSYFMQWFQHRLDLNLSNLTERREQLNRQ
jgi:hypothetical protein